MLIQKRLITQCIKTFSNNEPTNLSINLSLLITARLINFTHREKPLTLIVILIFISTFKIPYYTQRFSSQRISYEEHIYEEILITRFFLSQQESAKGSHAKTNRAHTSEHYHLLHLGLLFRAGYCSCYRIPRYEHTLQKSKVSKK